MILLLCKLDKTPSMAMSKRSMVSIVYLESLGVRYTLRMWTGYPSMRTEAQAIAVPSVLIALVWRSEETTAAPPFLSSFV